MNDSQAYQITRGIPRRVYGAKQARVAIQREAHALVVQTTQGETAKDRAHAVWFTDLRRGRLNIYGGLLRFIDHLARRGVPMETAMAIPEWLTEYIRQAYDDAPDEQNNGRAKDRAA